jgi:hypothetical protein
VTTVLLKEAWTWATASVTTRLVFFFGLAATGLFIRCGLISFAVVVTA